MAERILVFLVLGVVYINCAVLKAKAFYCRDPDTGKLHAVNTTWTAASFCGNYTCNLRKRNVTLAAAAPIREFNVTNISEQKPNVTERVAVTIEKKYEPDVQPLLHIIVTPDPKYKYKIHANTKSANEINGVVPSNYYNALDNHRSIGHNCKKHKVQEVSEESDRYLTEKEIDGIADLLHTIKKSDLDAIVDIYNLAQDIYKEMDEATNEEIKNEAMNIMNDEEIHRSHEVKAPSYWYDPLANKERMGEKYDMDLLNTLNVMTTEKPKQIRPNYFNGRLLTNDIGKTPFYYPVTQFQRISSYTHPTNSYKQTTQNADVTRKFEVPREEVQIKNAVENNKADSRKLIQPSHYLPYPFANIHPYNLTESRNAYYGNPWLIDYYNRYKYYQPNYNPYISPVQKAVLINPHLNNEVQGVEQQTVDQPVEIKKEKAIKDRDPLDALLKGQMISNWKTEPVPIEVLKDIRADIDTSRLLKAFPLRKKIKLDKVGKLMNIDNLNSQLNRNKRFAAENMPQENVTEPEEYETYLERVTCRDQVQLGYFRIGNLTQPYPECCPQLIDTR